MPENFTWKRTPQKVKDYFMEFLGPVKAKKLLSAMCRREWIIIDGPHGPTGKTTLMDILVGIGYTKVIDANFATTIRVTEPLKGRREKSEIFESLGISAKQ